MEQMELNAEIEAAGAEGSVLQAFSVEQDGIESYFERHRPKQPVVFDVKFKGVLKEKKTHVTVSTIEKGGSKDENEVYPANSTVQILQQQNHISKLISVTKCKSPRDIPVFEGDPLKFNIFM